MQSQQEKSTQASPRRDSRVDSKPVELKRTFSTSVELLFNAFKTSDAIKAWWWPKDLYTDRVDYEFTEGGHYFINMKGGKVGGGGMAGEFEEISENSRIVMSDHFADENGKEISPEEANMSDWTEPVTITFDFRSNGAKSSELSLTQVGIPNKMHDDCLQGWSEMFDKLEKHLARAKV
jgi:uncharacterized protein YndB with AHSA1/START domain